MSDISKQIRWRFDTENALRLITYKDEYVELKQKIQRDKSAREIASELIDVKGDSSKNYFSTAPKRRPISLSSFKSFYEKFESLTSILKKDSERKVKYLKWKTTILEEYDKLGIAFQKKKDLLDSTQTNATTKSEKRRTEPVPSHLQPFLNTRWFTYERENGLVSRKTLEFTDEVTDGACKFIYKPKDRKSNWSGEMRAISGDGLLVGAAWSDAKSKNESSYVHFAFETGNPAEPITLCIGHKTFFSDYTDNILTKTVIFKRFDPEKENIKFEPENFSMDDDDIVPDNLPLTKDICAFLEDRLRNRLTSPHRRKIRTVKSFRVWMKENRTSFAVDASIIGKYKIHYTINKAATKFITDTLEISEKLNGSLKATYREQGESIKFWDGIINEKGVSLSVTVEGPKIESSDTGNHKHIYLLIYKPAEEKHITTLTGLIAGVRRGNKGVVGRTILLTKYSEQKNKSGKTEIVDCDGFDYAIVQEFFNRFKDSIRVRPPYSKIVSRFSHLRTIIDKGEDNSEE